MGRVREAAERERVGKVEGGLDVDICREAADQFLVTPLLCRQNDTRERQTHRRLQSASVCLCDWRDTHRMDSLDVD